LISDQAGGRICGPGIRDEPAPQGRGRNQRRPEEEVTARRIGGDCGESDSVKLHVIDAGAGKVEIDLRVIVLDRRGHGLRSIDHRPEGGIAMGRSIRGGVDVGMIISVEKER